MNFLQKSATR